MAKLTFNSVVYLKSTLEKVYVRAIITCGQKKTYKLSNGMKVGIEELITEIPEKKDMDVPDGVIINDDDSITEIKESTHTSKPSKKSKQKKD